MSTNAGPGDDYYLRKIVDNVSFNKLTAPPQAYLDKGILYELDDGNLYFNGNPISGGGSGDVSGPNSSVVNNIALYDDTTGKSLKATTIKLTEPLTFKKADDTLLLSAKDNLSVSLGQYALQAETTGDNNTAIGDSALNKNTSGIYNTAVGSNCMFNTTTGGANTCVGTYAGYRINGNQNTLLGYYAARNATTANDTVAVGRNCLDLLTTGSGNIAVGNYAGSAYTTESGNICVGAAGVAGDLGAIRIGSTQTSAYIADMVKILPANYSVAIGGNNLNSATLTLDDASYNIAVGFEALKSITVGNGNTVVGPEACNSLTSGSNNTVVGRNLINATTANLNTIVGGSVLNLLTTGSGNIAIGTVITATGGGTGAESNNIILGNNMTISSGESNTIRIGGVQTKTFVAGVRGVTTVNVDAIPVVIDSAGQLGTVSSSLKYKKDVYPLTDSSIIDKLEPVFFKYKESEVERIGLIAEQVEKVYPEMCIYQDGELLTVDYARLSILLLHQVQQLRKYLSL